MFFTLIPVLALLSNYYRVSCLINVGTEGGVLLEEVVDHLVVGAIDCHAMTDGSASSTWNERRIARQVLVLGLLLALLATSNMQQP
ncbi:MAG: hypothetical protein LC114_09155 [Bryobacterales bacterium]|nr:hypothetical protein [Bryobacterales bacterium]